MNLSTVLTQLSIQVGFAAVIAQTPMIYKAVSPWYVVAVTVASVVTQTFTRYAQEQKFSMVSISSTMLLSSVSTLAYLAPRIGLPAACVAVCTSNIASHVCYLAIESAKGLFDNRHAAKKL